MAHRRPIGPAATAIVLVVGAASLAAAVVVSGRPSGERQRQPFALGRLAGWPTVTAPPSPALPPSAPLVARASNGPQPLPTIVRTLFPGSPRRLTDGGCCAGAWWAEDSASIRYLDRLEGAPVASMYSIGVWPPDSTPTVLSIEEMEASLREPVVIRSTRGYALLEDVASGDRWPLPSGGNTVKVSPEGGWAVWWEAPGERQLHDTLVTITAADIYGFDTRELDSLWGGSVVGFAPGGQRVLLEGRRDPASAVRVLETVDASDGTVVELASGAWLGDAILSYDRSWVAYMVSLDRASPEANGIWVVPLDGGEPLKMPFEGAYRWRDGHRLVYIALETGATARSLWEIDVTTMAQRELFGVTAEWLRIANNDWSVSPDGNSMLFRSELDRNLWVVDLPGRAP